MPKKIEQILKSEEVAHISQFSQEDIDWINGQIHDRADGEAGVECVIRGMNNDGDYFKLTPEEIIRQIYARKLLELYGYKKEQISFEEPVIFAGRSTITDKRIDIAVFDEEHKKITMIIEVKRPEIDDYKKTWDGESTTPFQQMQTYCNQKHPGVGVLVNGNTAPKFYDAPDYETQIVIDKFPRADEDIDAWKENRRFTLKQLMQYDRLDHNETLKDIILDVEQRFGANDSSDKAFEEIFKLIFIKLYDEVLSSQDADEIAIGMSKYHVPLKDIDDSGFRVMRFRVKETNKAEEIYINMSELFSEAKNKWPGVFAAEDVLDMHAETIRACVKELQNVKLFNSNLEVVDDAFEHLVNRNQKSEMGQFFTPRYVIDMCVKMLNPKPNEKMIDTAAGSCGFPMHTIFHVWKQLNPDAPNLFTTRARKPEELAYVQNNVFGIDHSEKSVRVGRMLNIIAGDGHTNVIYLNTLDYANWKRNFLDVDKWRGKYNDGFTKLTHLSADSSAHLEKKKYHSFNFDILMANPPFAGALDNPELLSLYDLGHKDGVKNAKLQNAVDKDILFIERNLNFLKPGGRMAVVLPQGTFNNTSAQYIREYILNQCRLLAIVGLHGNTFKNGKSGTGTKTSVLIVQKWTDESCGFPNICPKPQPDENGNIDYPIFFATMQEPSKDNSGNKIYVTENYVTWTKYKYITETIYIRKSDKAQVTKAEYDNAEKKTDYTVKLATRIKKETIDAIKDLYISEYGDLDLHRTWIRKNVEFILKNKKKDAEAYVEKISFDEYFALSATDQAHYKEAGIEGENCNVPISLDDYNALDKAKQKYYIPAETIDESSERVKDTHGHIFVKHDLFNHDPSLPNPNPNNIYSQDGIAEAFIEFAKREGLSFFQ